MPGIQTNFVLNFAHHQTRTMLKLWSFDTNFLVNISTINFSFHKHQKERTRKLWSKHEVLNIPSYILFNDSGTFTQQQPKSRFF